MASKYQARHYEDIAKLVSVAAGRLRFLDACGFDSKEISRELGLEKPKEP